jgi:hypothetical protein
MKKIFALLLVTSLFTLVIASTAVAFTAVPISDTATGEAISTLSNKVTLEWLGDAISYAAITGHINGSKVYGSSSEDTKIYSQSMSTVAVVAPGASGSTFVDTGGTWKPM